MTQSALIWMAAHILSWPVSSIDKMKGTRVRRQPYNRLLLSILPALLCLGASSNLLGQQNGTSPPAALSAAAVVLDQHGCAPNKIGLAAGSVLLEIVNRTGLDAITYHVRPVSGASETAGASVLDFTLQGRLLRAYHMLKLSTGNYQLTLDNGARWQCEIAVQ
jgi:hypothetical protein